MVELSVIVVTTEADAVECLPHLWESSFEEHEVLVRTDDGISTARNRGIREADAEKVVFVDDDAIPCDGYLRAADRALSDHPIVAGRIIHAGPALFEDEADHYNRGDTAGYTRVLNGCNMGFRQEVFETVGYFDENIDWGHDETEFRDRVIEQYPIYYEPDMAVRHSFADGRLDYWKKNYRLGRADPYYWWTCGLPYSRRAAILLTSPLAAVACMPVDGATQSVGRLARSAGRIRELL